MARYSSAHATAHGGRRRRRRGTRRLRRTRRRGASASNSKSMHAALQKMKAMALGLQ